MKRTYRIIKSFYSGLLASAAPHRRCIRADRALRDHLSERQIDKMVADSFPASDPPSTY